MRIKDKTQSKIAGFYECSKKESYFREELSMETKTRKYKTFSVSSGDYYYYSDMQGICRVSNKRNTRNRKIYN
ncbi:uncharacterized protein NEPG_02591 [Nematocida parisii ERTm1]|uniref:uncharacterized protein n=1 Tax=Nematocida parisii (strain ERTm1 / ATCC PRA-289) TaxID=881290 RepID=UPI000264B83A|nr:uncharacterized protein NEPG_02591 [Nematocida parisii ERTm1]EIJ92577.1 hypothetical protein NEPG_02591 [Nematocida parisii ERTm1]|eukprot:XP_013060418.1 hypothetical protein NEPG_02591 [Nematocida parisii ERTm1]